MNIPCTGIILAGGKHTRLPGINKALVKIGNKRIIDYIIDTFNGLFEETIIVTNEPEKFLDINATLVTDLYPFRCSLTGLHTGLYYSKTPYSFFTACDSPLLKKEMVKIVLNEIEEKFNVIVPEISEGMEPLCAAYSKTCLKPVEDHLNRKILQIKRIYKKIKLKIIGEKHLREVDPHLDSFFNVNTPQDLKKAKQLILNGER